MLIKKHEYNNVIIILIYTGFCLQNEIRGQREEIY